MELPKVLEVTQEDINRALDARINRHIYQTDVCVSCPVALALRRITGQEWVIGYLTARCGARVIFLSDELGNYGRSFVDSTVNPRKFEYWNMGGVTIF